MALLVQHYIGRRLVRPDYVLVGAGELVGEPLFPDEQGRAMYAAGPEVTVTKPDGGELSVRAMGTAFDDGGLWFMVRGATPDQKHGLQAHYPGTGRHAGQIYGRLESGFTGPDGNAAGLRLDPFLTASGWPDPPGIYRLTFMDASGVAVTCPYLINYRNGARRGTKSLRTVRGVMRRRLRPLVRPVMRYARSSGHRNAAEKDVTP